MVKLLGASLTAAACAWIGFRGAESLKRRYRAIRELEQGLMLLEQELELCAPPLPELMERLSAQTEGCGSLLFSTCSAGLKRLEETTFFAVWKEAVNACAVSGQDCIRCLLPLGETLGRYDVAAQIRAISAVRRQLDTLVHLAQEEYRRQSGVYRALGISGGAFLVILLL